MRAVFQMYRQKTCRPSETSEASLYGVSGEIRINEPMSRHTSWRTGGNARRYYLPVDLEDLSVFLQKLPIDEPVYMVGLGSNLLVRDGGLSGTVIAAHARLNDLRILDRDQTGGLVYAGAGVACAKVARFAARNQLAGAEFLAGIPGTIGGALAMNAGCYGTETWRLVEQVRVVKRSGEIGLRMPDAYTIDYRSVTLKTDSDNQSEWFAGAYIRLKSGDESESREKIRRLLALRVSSQPLNKPNAGSVFRNPPGDYAARLIESCGLKGLQIGGAIVSIKHANFILNTGHASANDIEGLILMVKDKVEQETGVALIQEVRIIGAAGRGT
ncbi:UDP-N-acetylmuramate dehydrogenase [Nitrosomonas marina]|uniref:UDP-N-acetylenolpyruvoylglucosamine reductase n=1 Tax=Nitrosomonas marina TaxID=917 RepID=A0A1H8BVT6_9PROT|nr:UDP-N-acetylmuramate dehydrogenase [Nitrosomonas marina]SEM86699.1 UDP-N-acetylmuramate dehydrogenase [Nitrosomonas marina]